MLLATRLKMTTDNHKVGPPDGTQIFEKLSAYAALNYFGHGCEGDVFGTGNREIRGFKAKLLDVIQRLGEGTAVQDHEFAQPQDDKVDIVVWKRFPDRKSSQLIAFGQCKTGTSWQTHLSELDTDIFCKNWMTIQPIVTPLKMFFCAQYFPREIWSHKSRSAGLIFDRCRILSYLPKIKDKKFVLSMKTWTNSAKIYTSINIGLV